MIFQEMLYFESEDKSVDAKCPDFEPSASRPKIAIKRKEHNLER